MINVRQVGPDDWNVYRDMRLEALQESPEALGDRYGNEKNGTEQEWRNFVQRCHRLVAYVDDLPAGTISVCQVTSGTAALTSLWVRPGARRHGVGDAIVNAALALATASGYRDVQFCVEESSEAAIRLYCRKGFLPTGESMPIGLGNVSQALGAKSALVSDAGRRRKARGWRRWSMKVRRNRCCILMTVGR